MVAAIEMPPHESQFHYNMTFAITRDGYATIVNLSNYYNKILFGSDFQSECVADVVFFEENGQEKFHVRRAVPEWGSVHIDVREALIEAGHSGDAVGTVYTRLIPRDLPAALKGKRVSTECTTEIINPSGHRDFIHNTGGRVHMPSMSRASSGVMFADAYSTPCYFVFVNNYFGPRLPYVSQGIGKIEITNHRGEIYSAWTDPVPARGLQMMSIADKFPDLSAFLDGKSGHLSFKAANLAPKPWIWFGEKNGRGDISIEHM